MILSRCQFQLVIIAKTVLTVSRPREIGLDNVQFHPIRVLFVHVTCISSPSID